MLGADALGLGGCGFFGLPLVSFISASFLGAELMRAQHEDDLQHQRHGEGASADTDDHKQRDDQISRCSLNNAGGLLHPTGDPIIRFYLNLLTALLGCGDPK